VKVILTVVLEELRRNPEVGSLQEVYDRISETHRCLLEDLKQNGVAVLLAVLNQGILGAV